MKETLGYSVGQVAALSGVTVRMLHHYDQVGILSPGRQSQNGYRRYDDRDLDRLRQILFYRELGFPLEEVASILKDAPGDQSAHLRRQHRLLRDRIARLQRIVAVVEKEMEARQMGISLTPEERFEVFGDFEPEAHAEEAEERWGDTDTYRQSQRRVAANTKEDWQRLKAQGADIDRRLAAALEGGAVADGEEAMDLAEEHRLHITRWFYECDYEIHRGLGDMYVADSRFTARYEEIAHGLAAFLRDAIHANARRAESN
ncbi:MAG: MerR family transcriptional regulator [Actinomycetota bacterium]|nr:MerR family transcriptional regulator [Actinomycetota bacterium]